jgi:SM-20-related protein
VKSSRPPLPPFRTFAEFLDPGLVSRLLDYSLSNQARFQATTVGGGSELNPSVRISYKLDDLGTLREELESRIMLMAPTLITDLHLTLFSPARCEIELVAHGDRAFYSRHIDTDTERGGAADMHRIVSGVYYFNNEPKAFSGGALRLYSFGPFAAHSEFVDIEPSHNTFVVFPSWVLHEVLPVSCPSKRFIDSRFAINCWLWRRKAN